jgi:probable F420-dependent oxidoreductase
LQEKKRTGAGAEDIMKIGLAGINTGPFSEPGLFSQLARDAEQLGFESIWTFEHIVVPSKHAPYPGTPDGQVPGGDRHPYAEPLIQLGYAAALTEKIKLATGVLLLPLHHPLYLAKQIATLDRLSGGRVMIGVSNGWMKDEFDALGVDFSQRGIRAEESILAMKALWRTGEASFAGTKIRFPEMISYPQPAQKDRIPIHVGGISPVAARRAGRIADGYMPLVPDLQRLDELVGIARDEARKRQRNPDAIEITTTARPPTLDFVKQAQDHGVSRVNFGLRDVESKPDVRSELRAKIEKIANEIIAKI